MAQKFQLPELPYSYDALEPVISAKIMELHYSKHHQAYVNNLNAALEKYEAAEKENNLEQMIALQSAIKFNGGGHINHSIFWTNLAPKSEGGGEPPEGALADAINKEFGSLDAFIQKFNGKAGPVQGSGWGWLGYDKANSRLVIETCANQDPLAAKGLIPLLGIDVWEHAYYLDYLNARPKYLEAIWGVVNWKNVAERYAKASS
ncbi:MAG: superoxide dismutase [Chlamydiia bacterium]|nr:superoxide dismutase [Chlamydiia bacterium]